MKELHRLQTRKNPCVKHRRDPIYFGKKDAPLELKYTKLGVRNHGNLLYLRPPANDSHKVLSLLDYRHPCPFRKGTGARRWRLGEQKIKLKEIYFDLKKGGVYIVSVPLYN